MAFVNNPLIKLKKTCYYKMWLVQFPIDIDCHRIIKQLYRHRQFSPPLCEDINKHLFYYNAQPTYINEQGVVFVLNFVIEAMMSILKISI